jgi:hypothetical protein
MPATATTTQPVKGNLFTLDGREFRIVAVRTSPSTGVEVVWYCRAADPRRTPDAWMTVTDWQATTAS